jgi:hypothetical protein
MLTRLIVASYVWLLEAALWFAIALAAVVGYHITVPIMSAAGAALAPEFAWKLIGSLVLSAFTFFVLAVVAGPILILIDVRQAARSIEARMGRKEDFERPHSSERREPSI